MDKDTITWRVIKEFGNHRTRDEIIRILSLEYACDWRDAETLVAEVEKNHTTHIARSQAPIFLILGVVGIIGGLYLIIVNLGFILMLDFTDPTTYRWYGRFIAFGTGWLMLIGSLAGSVNVVRGMFK